MRQAAFYEDETCNGVCPCADQRGNLSFIVHVTTICKQALEAATPQNTVALKPFDGKHWSWII